MAYVKVADPNIIDIAAWHQIINVVNQNSDAIAALTNNFGMAWSPVYSDSNTNWASTFDFGSSMIQFGRAKILATAVPTSAGVYYESVEFTAPFSQPPVVVVTPYNTGSNLNSNVDTIVTTSNLTVTGFTYRFSNNSDHGFTTQTYVNWVAIGPK